MSGQPEPRGELLSGYGERDASNSDIDRAIACACELFYDKRDRQGKPAILHALRVMLRGRTNAERVVGVLHDVIEDTKATSVDLRYEFDEEIVWAVKCLTRHKSYETYAEYIERIAPWPLARAVKLHDLADNLARVDELPVPECHTLRERYERAMAFLTNSPVSVSPSENSNNAE